MRLDPSRGKYWTYAFHICNSPWMHRHLTGNFSREEEESCIAQLPEQKSYSRVARTLQMKAKNMPQSTPAHALQTLQCCYNCCYLCNTDSPFFYPRQHITSDWSNDAKAQQSDFQQNFLFYLARLEQKTVSRHLVSHFIEFLKHTQNGNLEKRA